MTDELFGEKWIEGFLVMRQLPNEEGRQRVRDLLALCPPTEDRFAFVHWNFTRKPGDEIMSGLRKPYG